jgi:hypothetical protein
MERVADIKEKKRNGEKQVSSVVFAIKGKKMAQRCLDKGLNTVEIWNEVARYINAGPDTFCESCCGWGHHVSKCGRLGMVRCMLCMGAHKTEEHQCDVVGCKAKKGQNCNHNVNKYANCKGEHIAKSNECPKKRKAIAKAQDERTSWKDQSRARTNEGSRQQPEKEKREEVREDAAPSTREAEKKEGLD